MTSQQDLIYKKKYLKYKEKYLRLQQRLQRGGELTEEQIKKILTVLLSIKYIDKKRKESKKEERHQYKVSAITYALGLMNCISRFRYLKNEGDANPLIQMNTDAFNDLMVKSYRQITEHFKIKENCCDKIEIIDTGYQIIEEILYEEFKTITILAEANKELLDKLVKECENTIEELNRSGWSSNDTDQLDKDINDKTRAIIQYAYLKEEEQMRQQTKQQAKQQAKQPIDLRREQLPQREPERQLEAERELAQLEQMKKNLEEKKLQLEAISGNVTPDSLEKQAEQLAELSARFERSPKFKGSKSSSPSTQDSSGRGSALPQRTLLGLATQSPSRTPEPQRRLLGLAAQSPISRTPEPPSSSPSPLPPSRLRQPRNVQPSDLEVPVNLEDHPQPEIRTISRPAAIRSAAPRPPTNSSDVPTITFTPPVSASDADYASLNATIARIKAEQQDF